MRDMKQENAEEMRRKSIIRIARQSEELGDYDKFIPIDVETMEDVDDEISAVKRTDYKGDVMKQELKLRFGMWCIGTLVKGEHWQFKFAWPWQ